MGTAMLLAVPERTLLLALLHVPIVRQDLLT
jgi:hypothetical protein